MNLRNPETVKSEHGSVRQPTPLLADVIALESEPTGNGLPNITVADAFDGHTDHSFNLSRSVNGPGSSVGERVTIRQNRLSAVSEKEALKPARKERNQPIAKLIANNWSKNSCSMEETILELFHANLSIHQLEGLIDQLWGTRMNLAMISSLHQKVVREIEVWAERPITKSFPYVFLAGMELKCSHGYKKKEATVLIATGIDEDGTREVLGVSEGGKDTDAAWHAFLQRLRNRGLRGVRLFIGDSCAGLKDQMALIFPGMHFQTSVAQFHRDILSRIPVEHLLAVEQMLEAIDASEDWDAAKIRVARAGAELKRMQLTKVAELFEQNVWDTLNYLVFPREHQRGLRSNSPQIKLLRTISERTRMVGAFSDGPSAVHLVSARMRHIEATVWKKKRYPWGCM